MFILFFVAAAAGAGSYVSPAAPLTLSEVEAALDENHATWTARSSDLPLAGVGGNRDEQAPLHAMRAPLSLFLSAHPGIHAETSAPELPPSFDWRQEAQNPFLPVTAQGHCSSCVAFAVASALEAQLALACGATSPRVALSRQYLFACGGGSCRAGWRLSEAVDYLVSNGIPDDSCLPYADGESSDTSCANACTDRHERLLRGITANRATSGYIDVVEIKRALLRGPLVSSMILFEDLQFFGGGVYRHIRGNQIGSHAIVLVGWKDADQAWIARNSWGDGWGDGGYFEVAWDDLSLPGRYTWLFDVTPAVAHGACLLGR